jgi:hypothetical protein
LAEARRLYEQTLAPVDDICAMMDIAKPLFYRLAKAEGWRGRRAKTGVFQFARAFTEAIPLLPQAIDQSRAEVLPRAQPISAERRAAIGSLILGVAEQQMAAITRIVDVIAPSNPVEVEQSARVMASLSRSLREIKALIQPEPETPPDDADDDDMPRDIDAFRNELARRIRDIVDARPGALPLPCEDPADRPGVAES